MQSARLRQTLEASGQITAFLPNPPVQTFHEPGTRGHFRFTAVSISGDETNWVRGWEVSLVDGDEDLAEQRYIDADEIERLRHLLRKYTHPDVSMSYQYTSTEGVIFKVFHGNQHITVLTPGFAARRGMEGNILVQRVVEFMNSSAKLWEE